jgi:hypothetical protein
MKAAFASFLNKEYGNSDGDSPFLPVILADNKLH